jgi:hypothetical protein
MGAKRPGLTVAALRRAVETLKRKAVPTVIVLTPRWYAYAKRRGYLRNRNYLFIRAKKVGR